MGIFPWNFCTRWFTVYLNNLNEYKIGRRAQKRCIMCVCQQTRHRRRHDGHRSGQLARLAFAQESQISNIQDIGH